MQNISGLEVSRMKKYWALNYLLNTQWSIQISLGICPIWSESSLSAWIKLGSLSTNWVHSEDSDQTGWMPRLIWVFAGRTDHFVGFVMWQFKYHLFQLVPVWYKPHHQQGRLVIQGRLLDKNLAKMSWYILMLARNYLRQFQWQG